MAVSLNTEAGTSSGFYNILCLTGLRGTGGGGRRVDESHVWPVARVVCVCVCVSNLPSIRLANR